MFHPEHVPDYFVGSIFFILAWAILYWSAPKSRSAVLWASLTLLPIGPLLESIYVIDYWHPQHWWYWQFGWLRLSIEDAIFTFTTSGLCAGFFDLVYRRHHDREIVGVTLWSYARLLFAGLICLVIIFAIWKFGLHRKVTWLHSVNAHALGCLLALPFVLVRRAWLVSTLLASLGGAVLMCIFYALYYLRIYPDIFRRWWNEDVLSHITLFTIPIEEIYWMAATFLFIGPVVRFCMDVTADQQWLALVQFREWRQGGRN